MLLVITGNVNRRRSEIAVVPAQYSTVTLLISQFAIGKKQWIPATVR